MENINTMMHRVEIEGRTHSHSSVDLRKLTTYESELGFDAPVARAKLPSKYGLFDIYSFKMGEREHIALVMGEVRGRKDVLVRLHSSCMTGDIFGSYRCDCGPQLERAFEKVAKAGRGIILYMDQEGRGIGIYNKINAYRLQELGYDTVEANLHLGFGVDTRDFSHASSILHYLGPESIFLMTNNPEKSRTLSEHGIKVSKVVPLRIPPNRYDSKYLMTKKIKLKHSL